ncbi:hypothetical protein SKAU_G00230420 [Synaphobranchus kaupii]|uniref:Aldehyde oxidase/xanthine dehydrogenase first molybdopterin binding domain-containing protein n=1 Tax=Synaphobranchus kaupii TaxID=118154 RepID=A0A9Q1ITA3_SYNKA|nr:hypothetical protein SKAU_G00230420 [Synaphobranchus kaupii]
MLITSGRHPFLGKYKIMEKALLHMDNGDRIPNLRGRGFICRTYLPSYTASEPQGLTIIESVLHEVANKCGLPPEKVRDINMYRDEICYNHHKQLFTPQDMIRCWEECLEKSAYHNRRLAIAQFNANKEEGHLCCAHQVWHRILKVVLQPVNQLIHVTGWRDIPLTWSPRLLAMS